MNHLAHFYLAYPDKLLMAGGFLGDFIKGPLKGELPREIELGVKLHRAIDAYTDQHPIVRKSQQRFDSEFRRYSGIICDISYDHLLALNWHQHSTISLEAFSKIAYQAVLDAAEHSPATATNTILRMQSVRALEFYKNEEFVDRSLKSISTRLKRINPLNQAFGQFGQHKQALDEDFALFLPDVARFANEWINAER